MRSRLDGTVYAEVAVYVEVAGAAVTALLDRAEQADGGSELPLELLERLAAEGGLLHVHGLGDVRSRVRDLLNLRRAAKEARRPKVASTVLIAAYDAMHPGRPWASDTAYLRFSTSDTDGAAWPMQLRLQFAALLPRLAEHVPGLLADLGEAEVESLRVKTQVAAPEHFKTLAAYEENALAAGKAAFNGKGRANFPHGMPAEERRLHAICRYLRVYDFLTGRLVRIRSVDDPSMMTVVGSKVGSRLEP